MFEPEEFIELVKARPPLYNTTLVEYKTKALSHTLWQEISDAVKKDVDQCRKVWTSMRSSYARHLQTMENNVKGINHKKKKPWYLAEQMSFLDEFMLRTPKDRNLTNLYEEPNNTTTSADDNSMSISNYEYKSDNNCSNMDDTHSVVTIKSEDLSSDITLSSEEVISKGDVKEIENEDDPATKYDLSYQSILSDFEKEQHVVNKNQNTLKRKQSEGGKEPPGVAVSKQFKMSSSDEWRLTVRAEVDDANGPEDSALKFFKSILFDLRKLSDKKLRFFKQDILQDLNKYLDEDENEY